MVIVEILWHIKAGAESGFLEAWRTKFTVSDRSKLIGEYLCQPDETVEDIYKGWRVEQFGSPAQEVTAFVNVALWETFEAFLAEISKYIPKPGQSPPDWQVARYRTVLQPIAWRRGDAMLKWGDSENTK
jgi:hypothetical protein